MSSCVRRCRPQPFRTITHRRGRGYSTWMARKFLTATSSRGPPSPPRQACRRRSPRSGTMTSGLPIGVQIIGGYLEDRTTIAFAGLIEREFGGFTPPPNL